MGATVGMLTRLGFEERPSRVYRHRGLDAPR
jgi:hypothetical protein